MTNETQFKAEMHALGVAFNRTITDDHLTLYWSALSDLTDEEFARGVMVAVNEERYWPAPATLRLFARPEIPLTGEAGKAFEAINGLGVYDPEGYRWSRHTIRERLGPAALAGFDAIGGEAAWSTGSYTFRRKDFVTEFVAYRREEMREERLALASGGGTKRIKPAASGNISLSR